MGFDSSEILTYSKDSAFNDSIFSEVLANMIEKGSSDAEMVETLEKIESLKEESLEYVKISDELKPN